MNEETNERVADLEKQLQSAQAQIHILRRALYGQGQTYHRLRNHQGDFDACPAGHCSNIRSAVAIPDDYDVARQLGHLHRQAKDSAKLAEQRGYEIRDLQDALAEARKRLGDPPHHWYSRPPLRKGHTSRDRFRE